MNDLVALQLPEMLREHFFGQAGDPLPQFAKTLRPVLKIKQNQRFPFAANDVGGQLYRTLELFHPKPPNECQVTKRCLPAIKYCSLNRLRAPEPSHALK